MTFWVDATFSVASTGSTQRRPNNKCKEARISARLAPLALYSSRGERRSAMAFNLCRLHDAMKDPLEAINLLQGMGLLLASRACPECEAAMTLQVRARSADGYAWRCGLWMTREVPKRKPVKVQCRGEVSVRSGSFFEGSHLTLPQLMKIIYLWCQNLPCAVIQRETDVASKTITDWTSLCREVVVNAVFTHSEMIGGERVTVELDESMFGRRKYHRGYLRPGQWVFGGVERGSGCCFLVPVETRDANTLLGLIAKWVRPGTRIMTDCWAGYRKLADDARFTHLTVNHKLHFVDPNTGAHTNTVEGTWAHVKNSLPSGRRESHHFTGHLAKFMFWRREKARGNTDRFQSFVAAAAKIYSPDADRNLPYRAEDEDSDGPGDFE
ncbi:hypothetical protein ISCGN_026046 [Ixodes scapularis]